MKKTLSTEASSPKKSIVSSGYRIGRLGIVFSAAMVVMSLVSNLGTQLGNKLGMGAERASASKTNINGLLPYETPSFNIMKNVLVNDADALTLGVVVTSALS